MSYKIPEDGRTLTEPLLSVNPSSTGFTIIKTPTVPMKQEIRGTWHKLKLSMILIFAITILAVATLIYGCIKVAQAANDDINNGAALNQDIKSFQEGGYESLIISNFSVTSGQQLYVLDQTTDPYINIVEQNAGGAAYNSSIFQRVITIEDTTIPPQFNATSPSPYGDSNTTSNITVLLVVDYCVNGECNVHGSAGSFPVSVPLYITEEICSLQQSVSQCNAHGGYFDKSVMKCLKLFVLTQVCIKVVNDSNGWRLDTSSGGSGCVYPFTTPGIYEQRNYTTNTSLLLTNATIDFVIRSSDDPYISLQALTSGLMSLDAVVRAIHDRGIHLVVLAFIVIGLTLTLGFALFFIKRRVKREFRMASRIPNYYSRPPLFRYLALSIACFGIAIGAGFPLLAHWSELAAWTYTPFAGMMMIIWAGPAGMISLLIFWQMLMKTPMWATRMRSVLGGAVGACIMVLCALAIVCLMKPWRFVYSTDPSAPDQFQVFWGIIVVLTFFPFATLLLVLSARVFYKGPVPEDTQMKPLLVRGVTQRATPNTSFALFGLFVLFVVFLATAFLPPIWNVITVGVYNIWHSPFSIIPANNSNIAVIKLYLDVVVFYGFVLLVVVVGVLASMSRGVRNALAHWVRVRVGPVIIDTSAGEVSFILLVIVLSGWWFWWWYWGYSRIAQMPTTLERLARVLGHMTNLFSALLLFPVSRNSIWVEILGIPFERAIKYHRWAGVVVFISLSSHMLTWWVKWSVDGTLLHNIFSVQNSEHADNWSIPMVELTWLGAAVMVLLSQTWFRRRRFELFYYTHHFFIVFFLTGLIHAWSMWYFTGGGMILWFIDRLIRYYKSSKTFPVVDLQVHNGDTTQIILQPNGFSFRAGQYAFINIPSITPLEWHPFTISSAPGDGTLTFHIKNMGKSTWTARLARIYGGDGLSFARINSLPVVNIDGPYGNPPDITSQPNLMLVAGGIGITPMISILKDIYYLHKQNDPSVKHLKNIYLLWVVRDLTILNMFREVFDEIFNDNTTKDLFHIMLRVTQRSFSTKGEESGPPINPFPVMGRPNLHQEFADVAAKCGKHVLAMVCGPAPMVREVESASYKFHFDLHMETFEL